METKHTKGPWVFNETDVCIWPGETAERCAPVCTMFTAADPVDCMSDESDIYSDEETANARLIACAPELLVELQRIVSWMEQYRESQQNGGNLIETLQNVDLSSQYEVINRALGK